MAKAVSRSFWGCLEMRTLVAFDRLMEQSARTAPRGSVLEPIGK